MDPKIISSLIEHATSYVTYRKLIRENYPELDHQLRGGPYTRYAENLYLYLHGYDQRPNCPTCGGELTYIDRSSGYGIFCSPACSANSPMTQHRKKVSEQKKTPEQKAKTLAGRKKTMLGKYGVEHALQCPHFKSVAKQKYNSNDQTAIKSKRKDTMMRKYGVEHANQSQIFREKARESNLRKYGVQWPQQSPLIAEKSQQTRQRKYYEKLPIRVTNARPAFGPGEFQGVGKKYKWICNSCQCQFEDHIDDGSDPFCPSCNPGNKNSSLGEREIVAFLQQELGIANIIQNSQHIIPPKEIDIYLPEQSLAIEFNGLYWHSELKISDRKYHQKKYLLCEEKNIRLVQIFSDEWESKPQIVKHRLRHLVKRSETICFARHCEIRELDSASSADFLERYHIQGTCKSTVRLGAFFQDQLVAVMTFGKRAIFRSQGHELLRFACRGSIPGIASKLFKYFVGNYHPTQVFSYCDLRWGTGKVYESMHMKSLGITAPGYWYSQDGLTRQHRFCLAKHNLVKMGFSPQLTESQITQSLGYYRIWDAGHRKFLWTP